MECPTCGYVMDAFDSHCPRCARLGEQAKTPAVQQAERQEVVETVDQMMPRLQARAAMRPQPIRYAPPLGWPLTILIWLALVFNGLFLLVLTIGIIAYQHKTTSQADSSAVGGVGLLVAFFPAINIISLIAILRCQRWGFWVYTVFTVLPAVSTLLTRSLNIPLLILLAPAIAIFILALTRWDEFD